MIYRKKAIILSFLLTALMTICVCFLTVPVKTDYTWIILLLMLWAEAVGFSGGFFDWIRTKYHSVFLIGYIVLTVIYAIVALSLSILILCVDQKYFAVYFVAQIALFTVFAVMGILLSVFGKRAREEEK